MFWNTIEYKQDTNGTRLDTILRENDTPLLRENNPAPPKSLPSSLRPARAGGPCAQPRWSLRLRHLQCIVAGRPSAAPPASLLTALSVAGTRSRRPAATRDSRLPATRGASARPPAQAWRFMLRTISSCYTLFYVPCEDRRKRPADASHAHVSGNDTL